MKQLIISAIMICGLTSMAHADKDRGGGSGTAAEITRATEAFIQAVEKYPNLFPQVDPSTLRDVNPQILVSASSIKLCNGRGQLDAYSDATKNFSVFSYSDWAKKSWIEKVQLAGHERLVLAGLEESNKYSLSNKIYDTRIQDLIAVYGKPQDPCTLSATACKETRELELILADIAEAIQNKRVSARGAKILLNALELNIESTILLVTGLKEAELEKKAMGQSRREKIIKEYEERVRLAFENHFVVRVAEVRRMIEASQTTPDRMCVELE